MKLIHLLDLKQKQANLNQALMSTNHAGAMKKQLDLLTKQAEESDKQSKALMVFTVVTIVFVRDLLDLSHLGTHII